MSLLPPKSKFFKMEVLFLAYANDHSNPLETLTEEYLGTQRTLTLRELKSHYLMHAISHVTLKEIANYLTLFRDNLQLFHYSGHANHKELFTEDEVSRAEGIGHLLGQCKRLKLVVLNGCSTAGQVKYLHELGVPVVIATTASVGDSTATRFAIRFYAGLEAGLSINDAFEIGIGEVLALKKIEVVRSVGFPGQLPADRPLWGIFKHPEKLDAVNWKLPSRAIIQVPLNYKENELLLNAIYEALGQTNEELEILLRQGATIQNNKGKIIPLILDTLPAPISEHIRKLVAPSLPGNESEADKVGRKRLVQLVNTYTMTIDFLIYILLAQIWDYVLLKNGNWTPDPEFRSELKAFMNMSLEQRKHCDYFSILRILREALEEAGQNLFVRELSGLRQTLIEDEKFQTSSFFMETLRRQLGSIENKEYVDLCIRAEEALATVFSKLTFLGSYVLATIRYIDVRKFRSNQKAEFIHKIFKWHGALGIYDSEEQTMSEFMDNRSVVLLRKNRRNVNEYMSLSPFVLDENTFDRIPETTLSNLYFFAGKEGERLFFKFVSDPEHRFLDFDNDGIQGVSGKEPKYKLAIEQIHAFYSTVLP